MRQSLGAPPPGTRGNSATLRDQLILTPNPSPLIRLPDNTSAGPIKKIRLLPPSDPDSVDGPSLNRMKSSISHLRLRLEETRNTVTACYIQALPSSVLVRVIAFATDSLQEKARLSTVSRQMRVATFPSVKSVTLCPVAAAPDHLSKDSTAEAFVRFIGAPGRGQHVASLVAVDPDSVYSLPATTFGPSLKMHSLLRLAAAAPNVRTLDLRGVVVSDYRQFHDTLLVDLPTLCPTLESLKIGSQYLRGWQPQWWATLPNLREFVVGSRREDKDWTDVNAPPTHLHDDFSAFLRSPTLTALELWCNLSAASFASFFLPTTAGAVPALQELVINAAGNCAFQFPEENKDEVKVEKRQDAKGRKAVDDTPQIPRTLYPALHGITIAEVKERPELVGELAGRLVSLAPLLQKLTVVNVARNAPGRPPPPPAKGSRRTAAAREAAAGAS